MFISQLCTDTIKRIEYYISPYFSVSYFRPYLGRLILGIEKKACLYVYIHVQRDREGTMIKRWIYSDRRREKLGRRENVRGNLRITRMDEQFRMYRMRLNVYFVRDPQSPSDPELHLFFLSISLIQR